MNYNIAALFPEIILLVTLAAEVLAWKFRRKATPKTFYTVAKCGIVGAFAAALVLYNQSFAPYYTNDVYTTLFKLMVYLWGLVCFYLSLKWFLGMDRPSFRFYSLGLLSLLLLTAALSVNDLWALFAVLEIGFALNYLLLKTESDTEETLACARHFLLAAAGFALIGAWGAAELCQRAGSSDFAAVKVYLQTAEMSLPLFMACTAVLVGVLFKLGVAPFHFWMAQTVSGPILPAACYLGLVPIFAYYAVLIKLISNVFMPMYWQFEEVMLVFGMTSIVIGVAGANSESNLRRIFAYVALFNMGIVLAVLAAFDAGSIHSSFVYLLSYMLAMSGVYTVFYGLKSKGEYLETLHDVSGLAAAKPMLAAAMLVFLISMLGLPPLFGFLGLVTVLNDLAARHAYWVVIVILAAKLLMAYAYLKVIKTLYFDSRSGMFDRVDKGIYICLILTIALMIAVAVNPRFCLTVLQDFLN